MRGTIHPFAKKITLQKKKGTEVASGHEAETSPVLGLWLLGAGMTPTMTIGSIYCCSIGISVCSI